MIPGILVLLGANVAVLLGARGLLLRSQTGGGPADAVLFLLYRFLWISGIVLIAGTTHTLTPFGLAGWSLGPLAFGLLTGAHRIPVTRALPPALKAAGIAVLVLLARLALQVWFFAPHQGDALAYHLPKIAEWIQNSGFTREMGLHPSATFPAGFELVETWWVAFLHHDVLIEAAGVEFAVLAFASVFALGRHLGLESRTAALASILFVLTPAFHSGATSCLNDSPAAALILSTFSLVASRAPAPTVLASAALGLGVKPTYAYALPGIALLAFLLRREEAERRQAPRALWLLAASALAVGGFWYLRNLVWFGNPIYPVGERGYQGTSVAVQYGPRLNSFLRNFVDLIDRRIYDHQTSLGPNVDFMAGWGPAAFACGLPAMVDLTPASRSFRRLLAAFTLSLLSCLLLVDHHPWFMKYAFFFPAILCLAAAQGMHRSAGAAVVGWASLVFCFFATTFSYDLDFARAKGLALQNWSERSSLRIPGALRDEECIACVGGYSTPAYPLYRPDFQRRVRYVRADNQADLVRDLANSGTKVLYFHPDTSDKSDLLEACLRDEKWEPLGDSFYRLHPLPPGGH